MYKIQGKEKTVSELLTKTKYTIDYYQREYRWEEKHIQELLDDFSGKFFESYQKGDGRSAVEKYTRYYLGAIIVCERGGQKYIVDGQQRLTSLTLLLIYLNHLQKSHDMKVDINDLIFSEKYGTKTFNIDIEDRTKVIKAIYEGNDFDVSDESESNQNIWNRYQDIEREFPEDIKNGALPYFIDWLKDNVDLVQITAYSDEDAYLIFETMNDRGQQLTSTDMLKGYLLANISQESVRDRLNEAWKISIHDLRKFSKEEDSDFFRAWFRAKYAESIRERKRGAENKDFEEIARYHKWIRDNNNKIGLNSSADFERFLEQDYEFYLRWYKNLRQWSIELTDKYDKVFFNANNNFTLQYQLVLSSLDPSDPQSTTETKIRLITYFMDYYFMQRVVNYKSVSYSDMYYSMFQLGRRLRDKSISNLADILLEWIKTNPYQIDGILTVRMNNFTKKYLFYILARMTHFIETESDMPSDISGYLNVKKNIYQIEHIWADKYQRHTDEFDNEYEFREFRNNFGGLLLLPRKFNQSYSDREYRIKREHYFGQNLLAKSLNPLCYEKNPGFLKMKEYYGLPFEPYETFKSDEMKKRQQLYYEICKKIWNHEKFEEIVG